MYLHLTYNRFTVGVIIRILLLLGSLLLEAYALTHDYAVYVCVCIGIIVAGQIAELIRYVTRTNNELARFILAVKYTDFSYHFNEKTAPYSFRELRHAFNEVHDTFRQLRLERETHHQYLQTIIEFINTGILSFDAGGEVELMNQSFQKMLNVPYLKNIRSLQKKNNALYQSITQLKAGEHALIKLDINQDTLQLMLSATTFKASDKTFTLIAFQNVSTALAETETATWQKLLRVMTHELMNSVAPIASLSDTLAKRLQAERTVPLTDESDSVREMLDDVTMGVDVIHKRSEGLLRFAESYRSLSKIANPVLTDFTARELFGTIEQLMRADLAKKGIDLRTSVTPPHLSLQADIRLMEQVIINLVLNAAEAVKHREQPIIKLTGRISETNRPVIEVADNGVGIPPELAENIFIPFFTTNKNGSGIGLSLSKQVMQLHKGNIHLQSVEGEGTVFSLRF